MFDFIGTIALTAAIAVCLAAISAAISLSSRQHLTPRRTR
jgi:hypothetical protein